MRVEVVEIAALISFLISFYGLATNRNIIKSIIFTAIMSGAVVMFWLSIGFRYNIVPPILQSMEGVDIEYIADPLTQGLMITAIVIGLSVTAINIVMFLTFYRKHKTTDWEIARKRDWAR